MNETNNTSTIRSIDGLTVLLGMGFGLTIYTSIYPAIFVSFLVISTTGILAIIMLEKNLPKEQFDVHFPSFLIGIVLGNLFGVILISLIKDTNYLSNIPVIIFLSMFTIVGLITIRLTQRIFHEPFEHLKQGGGVTDQEYLQLKNRYQFYEYISSILMGIVLGIFVYGAFVNDHGFSTYSHLLVGLLFYTVAAILAVLLVQKIITKDILRIHFPYIIVGLIIGNLLTAILYLIFGNKTYFPYLAVAIVVVITIPNYFVGSTQSDLRNQMQGNPIEKSP